ncbi:MAG: glycosyltransferase family 8 protein [Synergistaceae bacterium]|jgi:lipopolysaccharide biosynthesis glycosyltransferase|nr:glycosyltransferase family 8 protein [Synergistaceae bacterium]
MNLSDKDTIHVALGVYDPKGTYSPHAGVVMTSIFERTRSAVCVHILHDDTLSSDNRAMFIETAENFGQRIEFHDVSPERFGRLALRMARKSTLTPGTLFRMMIPELVAADKIIYLDSDIVVNMDIKQLWEVPMGDFSFAGVVEGVCKKFSPARLSMRLVGCDPNKYFNAGVLVMNLSRIRNKYNLLEEINEWFEKRGYCALLLDQDFINSRFRGDIMCLDGKFNSGRRDGDITDTIIHALGNGKPWDSLEGSAMESLYWKSYLKTAWALRAGGNEKIIDMMLEVVRNSRWTHRHSASCYRNILKRFWKDIVMNDVVRIVTLLAKYLYGKAENLIIGIIKK